DPNLSANWNTLAAKYSAGTWKIVAPKATGNKIKTDGFTFDTAENGGISVVTPDYNTFNGTYGVSAVTGNTKTSLDGLSVVITPDEYDSMIDSLKSGNIIGILWTEEKIIEIAKYNEATSSYDKGLYTAVQAYDTGLRHLIPTAENATPLTPATDPNAVPVGQALYISLTCNVAQEENAPIATSVRIVYYDGYYMNDDGNPGYRWIFTARNHSDTLNSDSTRLSQPYESVDMSKGIAINVRADEELGFIVNINGYDYCRGEDVGYFPDAKQDWYGYRTKDLNDDKIEESDPLYLSTMTYAKADIDLSGLKTAGDGYVTVGAVSNNDKNLEGHGCNYTVDTINGIPAASWNGEAVAEHECDFVYIETVDPNCTRDGYDYYRCSVCGKQKTDNIIPHIEHIAGEMKNFEDAVCDNYGTMAAHCTICKRIVESYAIPKPEHTFTDEVTVIKEATCNVDGIVKKHCSTCGKDYEIAIPADPTSHVIYNPVSVIETVDGATDWFGKVNGTCEGCGEYIDETVDMYGIVKHFADVSENSWFMSEVAYCVNRGYVSGMSETTFAPNNNLTRAQFL
ncbi:MAG: S-layer homology domain-containing protein, partial [Clostridia bacterium]|nr:S-layer homology domain-containing protein [Clostridia bacterium]